MKNINFTSLAFFFLFSLQNASAQAPSPDRFSVGLGRFAFITAGDPQTEVTSYASGGTGTSSSSSVSDYITGTAIFLNYERTLNRRYSLNAKVDIAHAEGVFDTYKIHGVIINGTEFVNDYSSFRELKTAALSAHLFYDIFKHNNIGLKVGTGLSYMGRQHYYRYSMSATVNTTNGFEITEENYRTSKQSSAGIPFVIRFDYPLSNKIFVQLDATHVEYFNGDNLNTLAIGCGMKF